MFRVSLFYLLAGRISLSISQLTLRQEITCRKEGSGCGQGSIGSRTPGYLPIMGTSWIRESSIQKGIKQG